MDTKRILLSKRRKGSLSIEMALVLPIAVCVTLLAAYVAEAMMFRTEATAAIRTAAHAAAGEAACVTSDPDATTRVGTSRSLQVSCRRIDEEADLRRVRPFFEALRRAASAWPELVDGIQPDLPIESVIAEGQGSIAMTAPPYLQNFGTVETSSFHRVPTTDQWDHGQDNWRRGYDPEIWAALSEDGTYQLFPNVFPSR